MSWTRARSLVVDKGPAERAITKRPEGPLPVRYQVEPGESFA